MSVIHQVLVALAHDRRGASYVESLVLLAFLALALLAGVQQLTGEVSEAAQREAVHVANLSMPARGGAGAGDPAPQPRAAYATDSPERSGLSERATTAFHGSTRPAIINVAATSPLPSPGPAAMPAAPPAGSPVPEPSPGPSPAPPPPVLAPAAPLEAPHSPPIAWRPIGTSEGTLYQIDDSAARAYLFDKLDGRRDALARADVDVDTDVFGPSDALRNVHAMKPDIDAAAARYGVHPALLAGTIAAEIDLDTSPGDLVQSGAAWFDWYPGQGPGVANVHLDTLARARQYVIDHHLPGWQSAQAFEVDKQFVHHHNAEAAAIVLAMKADLKRQAGGSVHTREDMALIFGTYRAGEENFDLRNNRNHNGGDDLARRAGDPRAVAGANAYLSEAYFDYYVEYYEVGKDPADGPV